MQLSDKSDNMIKYLIDFFLCLNYIGEDSAISGALGPRSKIMLISDIFSLEATCRKSKVLDTLLSQEPNPPLNICIRKKEQKHNGKASKIKYIYDKMYIKNCLLACLLSELLFS